MEDHFAVRLRGLPFDVTENQVIEFLSGCKIKNDSNSIRFLVGPDSRPLGEAFVVLENQEDLANALKHHRESLGHRYVEVMPISKVQMENELSRQPGESDDCIIRLRGLPFSATVRDILSFLGDCKVLNEDKGVTFTFTEDGRPSGEAFVDLCSEEDVSKALGHNNEHMGRRYVEIFRSNQVQKEWDCRVENESSDGPGGSYDGGDRGTGVVRLRGLPYGSQEDQVNKFFSGLSIVPGSIVIQTDDNGEETGEGFVEFTSKEEAEKALGRDRQSIGHRYIELFRSTKSEIKPLKSHRPTPYDRPQGGRGGGFGGYGGYGGGDRYRSGYERSHRGRRGGRGGFYQPYNEYDSYSGEFYEDSGYGYNEGYSYAGPRTRGGGRGGGMISYPPIRSSQPSRGGEMGNGQSNHAIRMRGLPYSAKEKDVKDFFSPQVPTRIHIEFDDFGRPSGEGEVTFSTHEDAVAGMSNNNKHMGHRYVELFLHSSEDQSSSSGPTQSYPPPSQPQQQQPWIDPRGEQGPPSMGDQNQLGSSLPVGVSAGGYAGQGAPPGAPGGFQPPPQQQSQVPYQQPTGYGQSSVTPAYQQQPQAGYQPPQATQASWGGVGY